MRASEERSAAGSKSFLALKVEEVRLKPDALKYLADALAEDVLESPLNDLVAEEVEDAGDVDTLAVTFDQIVASARASVGAQSMNDRIGRADLAKLLPNLGPDGIQALKAPLDNHSRASPLWLLSALVTAFLGSFATCRRDRIAIRVIATVLFMAVLAPGVYLSLRLLERGTPVASESDTAPALPRVASPPTRSEPRDMVIRAPGQSGVGRATERTRAAQQELARVGCYRGAIDGEPSPTLQEAVNNYRKGTGQAIGEAAITEDLIVDIRGHDGRICPPAAGQ
jgi:hypothetical protein